MHFALANVAISHYLLPVRAADAATPDYDGKRMLRGDGPAGVRREAKPLPSRLRSTVLKKTYLTVRNAAA